LTEKNIRSSITQSLLCYILLIPITTMSVRIQVILDEEEAAKFRFQAKRESVSLSGWLKDAGKQKLKHQESQGPLKDKDALIQFFKQFEQQEQGIEPNWDEHKKIISDGMRSGSPS